MKYPERLPKTKLVINLFPVFLVFLILKLTGVIDWSWWWVTCPLWIAPAIIIGFLCALAVVAVFLLIIRVIVKLLDK